MAGLSGAGKSTFITSLIAQLRGLDEATLTSLSANVEGRLRAVELRPPSKHREELTPFAVEQYLSELGADVPAFPPSTQQPSAIDVRINYVSRRGKRKALTLEITDFPGEWLVDTALLEMSYSEWNSWQAKIWSDAEQNEILQMLGRLQLEADIAGEASGDDAAAANSEASGLNFASDDLETVFTEYRNFLQSKRSESGGSLYTPGQVTGPNNRV